MVNGCPFQSTSLVLPCILPAFATVDPAFATVDPNSHSASVSLEYVGVR